MCVIEHMIIIILSLFFIIVNRVRRIRIPEYRHTRIPAYLHARMVLLGKSGKLVQNIEYILYFYGYPYA